MKCLITAFAVVVPLAVATPAAAQSQAWVGSYGARPYYYRSAVPYRGWGPATALGSYYSGAGYLVQSWGQYNLDTSRAAINLEEARSMALENDVKRAETYFERRRINQSYRDATRRPPVTAEALASYNAARGPKRVTPGQLDPVTGSIHWPLALRDERFTDVRGEIEALFARRAAASPADVEEIHNQVAALIAELDDALRGRIRELRSAEFLTATKLLKALAYESSFPATFEQLASSN